MEWAPMITNTSASSCWRPGDRARGSGPRAPVEVLEAREFLQERELHRPRGSVALLADDDLGQAAVLVGGLVLLLAVDEHHDVRVLLEAAALPKVRELRPLLRAGFGRARELAERDHGHAQLLGQALERPAARRDFLLSVRHSTRARHELQVVDDDEGEAVLRLQPAALRAHLQGREGGG